MTSFPSSIPLTLNTSVWSTTSRFDLATGQNATDTSTKHYDAMYNGNAQYDHGIQFRKSGTSTYIDVEGTGDSGVPHSVSIGSSYSSAISVDITNAVGSVVSFWDNSSNRWYYFTVTSNMLFVSATGPTVTSITVANQNSATRSFTVAHTGTLSASDINYHIDEVDITSLGSPNTPITNLQTTTNGSTFDSYVLARNGMHTVEIGSQILQFFVTASQTATGGTDLSNYTVVFPTTVSAWHATYGPPYFTTCTINTYDVRFDYNDTSGVNTKRNTLFLSTNYRHSSNASTRGYYYQHSTYEYNAAIFTELTAGYIDPVALQTSTGSPNASFSLSGNLLPGLLLNTYYWDFATYTAPPPNPPINDAQDTTASNGGGKPDRYPLIMTNLFNRNRSIYSIGMTHKDTWDLFL